MNTKSLRWVAVIACVAMAGAAFFWYVSSSQFARDTLPDGGVTTDKEAVRAIRADLYSASTSLPAKIEAIKTLKEISLDEDLDKNVRVLAGQTVVGSFFDFGARLSPGFSQDGFSEREIYEYAKHIDALGESDKTPILVAYIGLRFYSDEVDKEFVAQNLRSYQRYVKTYGDPSVCSNNSKFSSVLYLSKKSGHADVTAEFGDYYSSFEKTFTTLCPPAHTPIVAFMWLAALSDIGNSEKETQKAQELVSFITSDTSENAPLVKNLRYSYFGLVQEPDTASIVSRLVSKYPEFKAYIEKLAKAPTNEH